MDKVRLLAMAPSGETFLARDQSGRVWLYQPLGAGAPEVVDENLVERAIADHGFERIDEGFPTWQALDEFRQGHAERLALRVKLDRDDLDLDDAERFLGVARRWTEEGEGPRARKLLLRLLRLPAVRADAETHDRIVSALDDLEAPPMAFQSPVSDPLKIAAREQWERRLVAA